MKFIKSLLLVVLVISISACATIFTGTDQNINVKVVSAETNEVLPDAVCTLTDGEGIPHPITSGEGSVVVQKGKGSLRVDCRKKGYAQKNIAVGQNFNNVTIVNLLFWPGIIVDAVTGAMQKYPKVVVIQMQKV